MPEYKDKEGNVLREGFYSFREKDALVEFPIYFMGEMDAYGNSIFEGREGVFTLSKDQTRESLSPIEGAEKAEESTSRNLENFKFALSNLQDSHEWVQKKRSQLERTTDSSGLGSSSPSQEGGDDLDDEIPF